MATVKTPPEDWVQAAFEAMATGGVEAVRIETIAASLGVSKGGFYWHFSNRAELLERVLADFEGAIVDAVIAAVDAMGDDPRAKLRGLFEIAIEFGLTTHVLGVELAIREWARRDKGVAARLKRVDDRRMEYMRTLFSQISDDPEDVEARCMIVGALFVSAQLVEPGHPAGITREAVLRRAIEHVLD